MLRVLCARHRPWLLTTLSLSYAHGSVVVPYDRLVRSSVRPVVAGGERRDHLFNCPTSCTGTASIWQAILPSGWRQRRRAMMLCRREHEGLKSGEGSWNVAWDARPARWLHHPESAWLLFGVCPLLDFNSDVNCKVSVPADNSADGFKTNAIIPDSTNPGSSNYRVTGVPADGRCLFRAIAHMACLRNEEKAPDENRQRELADELRAQVVEELLKRRKEVEWFIEEDFDAYVTRIKQPYVWGGEPELLMASHVLRTPISVFMIDGGTDSLIKIANYGEEYSKDEESPINVLFHGYGHYDILETTLDQSRERVNA
ncbi:Hypothetical predicted protein [Olea europaea subsp. europaea]|uniref:Ubiquitin thioesterase OTU n=2 Tax=Olea europaea subsp. europaea TaxID=158383 RepID=A0A8S0PDU8_OLEEU|nr:Hypothetical predicted protein [Olea europaea subsp. europaea]